MIMVRTQRAQGTRPVPAELVLSKAAVYGAVWLLFIELSECKHQSHEGEAQAASCRWKGDWTASVWAKHHGSLNQMLLRLCNTKKFCGTTGDVIKCRKQVRCVRGFLLLKGGQTGRWQVTFLWSPHFSQVINCLQVGVMVLMEVINTNQHKNGVPAGTFKETLSWN